jgi:ribonuclease P protein component
VTEETKIAGLKKPPLERIKKRPEYLAVANTRRKWVTPAFILQAQPTQSDSPPKVGFTVSKKVGKAVIRSRAKRRLKEAARQIFPHLGTQGWGYVLIGRQAAVSYPFEKLCADMRWALAKLAAGADLNTGANKKRR